MNILRAELRARHAARRECRRDMAVTVLCLAAIVIVWSFL